MDTLKTRWWWPFGQDETNGWRCWTRHPVYNGDQCQRTRFHLGQHLHPDTGYWLA